MGGSHSLQVIDVVDKDALQLVHGRVDVARHRDIDEKHRLVAALVHERLAVLAAEDGVRRAGRSNDDIGPIASAVEIFKAKGLSVELIGQVHCPVVGAVGHEDRSATMRQEMPCRQLAHLARANQVDALAAQVPENLLGKLYRDRRDRN